MTIAKLILPSRLDALMLDPDYIKALAFAFPDVPPGMKPFGGRVLVQIRRIPKVTKGGIELPPEALDAEKWNTQVGKVVALGPLAFKNTTTAEPWPEGSWCKVGDFVRTPKFGGDRWEVQVPFDKGGDALFCTFNAWELIGGVDGDPLAVKAYL